MATRIDRMGALFDAVERGDREQMRALIADLIHPDCEWFPLILGVEGRVYRGPDGMASFFDDLLGSFEVRYVEREVRRFGDRLVVGLSRMELRGRQSSVAASQELGVVYEFEDGRIRRGRAYTRHADALAAAEALR